MSDSFAGKVVWITGASSGIGEALAYAFARSGARVILSARRTSELERVRQGCGGDARVLPLDLTALDALPGIAERALGTWGQIDVMVHNAGVAARSLAAETPLSVDQQVMTTDYFGAVVLTKALLPGMLQRRAGRFVVVSSLSGVYGVPKLSAYAAAKHALHGYFESLRAEVHRQGIRVTIVIPGFVRTSIVRDAITPEGGTYGRNLRAYERGIAPDVCAARILQGVARGREEVLVGGLELWSVRVSRLFPWLWHRLVRNHPVRLLNRLRP